MSEITKIVAKNFIFCLCLKKFILTTFVLFCILAKIKTLAAVLTLYSTTSNK